jgi:hypothetical protein
MTHDDPYRVLGIAPTLDPAAIKRAYFARLSATPPHQDPDGFRRLRSAYEALQQPTAARLAWLATPPDVAHELAAWQESFAERIEVARDALQQVDPAQQCARLIAWASTLSYAELKSACSAPATHPASEDRGDKPAR